MPVSTPAAPNSAVSKIREKLSTQPKGPRKKANSLQIIALVAIVALCGSGIWRASQHPSAKMVRVLVPAKDVPSGTRIGFMMLRYTNIPTEVFNKDMAVSLNSIANRQCRTFLPAGEPILRNSLFNGTDGLSANLKSAERALTLQLTEDELVDHSINPDDMVDVISVSSKDGKKFAKTICQNVRVLTCVPKAQMLAKHLASAGNKITLALSPASAELVSIASETGKVRLVLRGRYNAIQEALSGVSLRDLVPADILRQEAIEAAKAEEAKNPIPVPQAPASTVLPPAPSQASFEQPPPPAPLEWVVQMFSGSKKDNISVPEK